MGQLGWQHVKGCNSIAWTSSTKRDIKWTLVTNAHCILSFLQNKLNVAQGSKLLHTHSPTFFSYTYLLAMFPRCSRVFRCPWMQDCTSKSMLAGCWGCVTGKHFQIEPRPLALKDARSTFTKKKVFTKLLGHQYPKNIQGSIHADKLYPIIIYRYIFIWTEM